MASEHGILYKYVCSSLLFQIDIDECYAETDNCHADANCSNTKGSFYCTCHTGYSGDGVICEGKMRITSV